MDAAAVSDFDAGAAHDADAFPDARATSDASTGFDAGGSDAVPTQLPYDTCAAPLDISAGGIFTVDIGDAHGDYPNVLDTLALLCGGILGNTCHDVVATFHLDEARDVSILADTGVGGHVAIALRSDCDNKTDIPIDIANGAPTTLRHRALPAGTYFVFIGADPPDLIVIGGPPPGPLKNLALTVSFSPVTPVPTNETCATALDIGTGGHFEGNFVDVGADVQACGFSHPDLVYTFTTSAPSNVHVAAQANPQALLQFTLRSTCGANDYSDCFFAADNGVSGRTYYNLPAGQYFLILEDWGSREPAFTFDVDISSPGTPAPTGDTCAAPIPIQLGVPFSGSLAGMQEDVPACGVRQPDVVHEFTLSQESDVWIQAHTTSQEVRVGLLATCDEKYDTPGHCNDISRTPGQVERYVPALEAGTYYVVVSSTGPGGAYDLSLEAWSPLQVTPVSVAGNESCSTAYNVPPDGGVFVGDTTMAEDDTDPTACTSVQGGVDVAFRWTTTVARRVLVTTSGSSGATMVELRNAQCQELACDGWSGELGSALDLMLQPGTYLFVVDSGGWYSQRGEYRFELRPL